METTLPRAFFTNNKRVEMTFCMSLLHHDRPKAPKERSGNYYPAPLPAGLQFRSPIHLRIG